MTWDIPTQRQRIPVAGSGQTAETSQLSAAVLQDRSLRADRFGALLAMVRAGDVQTPARDWIIDPANYGVAPSAGVYPFRVIEGVTATIPLPLPRSDGRTVGTGSGFETRGGMRIGTRGRRVHLRVTLTDLETSATNSVVIEHGTADGWENVDLELPLGSRSGNRIRVDVDARWTDDSEPARIGAVCCWWGGAQDVRGTGIFMFGDATIWIEDSFVSRPTLNLRDGDLLLIDGGATTEEGWSFRYDIGTGQWRLVMAPVATWAARPLPGTLPSGAALDSGSRLTVDTIGRRDDVAFAWTTGGWVNTDGLRMSDAFDSSITAGSRLLEYDAAEAKAALVGASGDGPSNVSSWGSNGRTTVVLSAQTARYETLDGYPAHVSRVSTQDRNQTTTSLNFGTNVGVWTMGGVCALRQAADGQPRRIAVWLTTSGGGNGYRFDLRHNGDGSGSFPAGLGALIIRGVLVASAETISVTSPVPGNGEWFAVAVRVNWGTGAVDVLTDDGSISSFALTTGTNGNSPTATNYQIVAGDDGILQGINRRLVWLREGPMTDDDLMLSYAIMARVRGLGV
jgi:hypothetical protein